MTRIYDPRAGAEAVSGWEAEERRSAEHEYYDLLPVHRDERPSPEEIARSEWEDRYGSRGSWR